MATLDSVLELKQAVKDALDRSGALNQMKAQLRAAVLQTLSSNVEVSRPALPQLPNETFLINELIREYLVFNNYLEAASVFVPETEYPLSCCPKSFAEPKFPACLRSKLVTKTVGPERKAEKLGVPDNANSAAMPLLYSVVALAQGHTQAPAELRDDRTHT